MQKGWRACRGFFERIPQTPVSELPLPNTKTGFLNQNIRTALKIFDLSYVIFFRV
jgi:hypothetical protein